MKNLQYKILLLQQEQDILTQTKHLPSLVLEFTRDESRPKARLKFYMTAAAPPWLRKISSSTAPALTGPFTLFKIRGQVWLLKSLQAHCAKEKNHPSL